MKSIRISSDPRADLAIYFDEKNGRPRFRTSTLHRTEVERQVGNWLTQCPEGTEQYSFVEQWYEAFEISPQINTGILQEQSIARQNLLFAHGSSRCCHSEQLLVRSRKDFISKNCSRCGRPSWVRSNELPICTCGACGSRLRRFREQVTFTCVCNVPETGNYRRFCRIGPKTSALGDWLRTEINLSGEQESWHGKG